MGGSAPKGQVVPLRPAARPLQPLSDAALMAACATGDQAALAGLFDRHHQAVHHFLLRLTQASSDELDDLLQQTFVEVWRTAPKFSGRSSPRTWIFGIACNVARHHRRAHRRRDQALDRLASLPVGSPEGPEERVERQRLLEQLGAAVGALPSEMAEAFLLCDVEGIPGVVAANTLGVRPGTLWRRLHYARKRLAALLGGAG